MYRTDFVCYAKDLLDFVEERLTEAQEDRTWRDVGLSEAIHAPSVLKARILDEEREEVFTRLVLISFL